MSLSKLKAALVIVSDTAFENPSTEKSGDILTEAFNADGDDRWLVEHKSIVPDDETLIQKEVISLCDEENYMNLVVTTGGTGFAVKDRTPEAVNGVLHKHAPGLVHGMLAASLEITPFALMSRPVAGVRNKTLVITLPGSPKGAKENLLAILKLLPHACIQAAGADSRELHAAGVEQLEKEAGVSKINELQVHPHHNCGSHSHTSSRAHTASEEPFLSNDPQNGPAHRHRVSPYPMISVAEALRLIQANIPPPQMIRVTLQPKYVGYVLAEDIYAKESVPSYRASMVDGYAITVLENGSSARGIFRVTTPKRHNPFEEPILEYGRVARITTGSEVPKGATCVVMVEDTILRGIMENGEEREIEIMTDRVRPNENIREIGSDVRVGDLIMMRGEKITAGGGEMGLLSSVGVTEVTIFNRPTIGVLSTGSELVPYNRGASIRPGEVRDCNRSTIMAALHSWGFECIDLGIVRDELPFVALRLKEGLRRTDVVISTGGVSMGERDLVKPVIERSLGGTIHFGRVAMKPGKPTTFATMPYTNWDGVTRTRVMFALPGNPAAALVTLHVLVYPAVHTLSGILRSEMHKVIVYLEHDVHLDPERMEFHRVFVKAGMDGRLYASSTGNQRSSTIAGSKGSNALLLLPPMAAMLKRGHQVGAYMMDSVAGM